MKLELDKEDLMALVKGTSPYYNVFENPLVKKCGSWTGGHVDKWSWGSGLDSLSDEDLYKLYNICKDSWK